VKTAGRPGATPTIRGYYDDAAGWYDRGRGQRYHQLVDELALELIARHGRDRDVLEVGCGTGRLLAPIAGFARRAVGVDLSAGMLAHARARGLDVVHGSATALPIADASVDVACAFKVLAHVPDVRGALAELARVVRPGGWVLAEFYNARSLRRLVKRVIGARPVSARTDEAAVYTRYDRVDRLAGYLPPTLRWVHTRGVRILTPAAAFHELPLVGGWLARAERAAADRPGLRRLGGFVIVVAQRV
jgi:ubiquinone/menaquinone biosynthesis C-methylase UbiE